MGDFSRLDRLIRDQELEYLKAANAEDEFMDIYISSKRRATLDKKDVKDMSWDEIELKNEMNQPKRQHYFDIEKASMDTSEHAPNGKSRALDQYDDQTVSDPDINTMKADAFDLIRKIKSNPNCDNETYWKIQKVETLLEKINTDKQSIVSDRKQEQIADEPEISVSKSEQIIRKCIGYHGIIQKSDTVEGFCSSDIVDNQGEHVAISVIKAALPEFLNHGTIMFQHGNRPLGKIFYHDFRKTDSGSMGLYIKAKLYPGTEDIQKEIGKSLTGFSIGGVCDRVQKCNRVGCIKDITNLKLFEVSIVEQPCNRESILRV